MQSSAMVVESYRRIGQGCGGDVAGAEWSAASTLALVCFRLDDLALLTCTGYRGVKKPRPG
jgi:hypothetical protein